LQIFGTKVPATRLSSLKDALNHPQARSRNMVIEVDLDKETKVKLVGNPIKGSGIKGEVFNPPPRIGQDTAEILESLLSFSQEKIAELRDEGII